MMAQQTTGVSNQEAQNSTDFPIEILIVEDNSTNARLSCEMLASAGYSAIVATNGEAGLRLAKQRLPALILLDLQMPDIDGLTLARQLKADPTTASIPLIMLTAHAMDEHREQALQAGCSRFVTKPVRYRSFLDEVAQVLKHSALTQGARR